MCTPPTCITFLSVTPLVSNIRRSSFTLLPIKYFLHHLRFLPCIKSIFLHICFLLHIFKIYMLLECHTIWRIYKVQTVFTLITILGTPGFYVLGTASDNKSSSRQVQNGAFFGMKTVWRGQSDALICATTGPSTQATCACICVHVCVPLLVPLRHLAWESPKDTPKQLPANASNWSQSCTTKLTRPQP